MQPYQPNPIEARKQQVRKDSRNTAIALGVTVVSLPVGLFASSFFTVVAILAGMLVSCVAVVVAKSARREPAPAAEPAAVAA